MVLAVRAVPFALRRIFAMRSVLAFLAFALALTGTSSAQLLPPNGAGVTMGHVHLNVKDVEGQRKFWVEQFDAVPLKREGLQGVKVPGMLILFTPREPTAPSEGGEIDHFGFKVRSLAEMLKGCRARGLTVEREFIGNEGFPNAYVIGPEGVKVEMQEDTSLPVRAAAHHVHFTSKDIPSLQAWYMKTFGGVARKRGALDTVDVAEINLSFNPARDGVSRPGSKGRALDHIGFEVTNLEAFCKNLEASGVKFDIPFRQVPALGIAIAFLTDPEGGYIELTEGLDKY